jgi:Xaa-Pro dipeptidase
MFDTPTPDVERLNRLRAGMAAAGLDALFLRLPENILHATGFWPASGFCAALVPRDGDAVLFVPEGEEQYAASAWTADVRLFPPGAIDRAASFYDLMAPHVATAVERLGLGRANIATEASFDMVATAHWQGEVRVPAPQAEAVIRAAAPDARFADASNLLREARRVKSVREIAAIEAATRAANTGLEAGRAAVQPGASEIDVALAIQAAIARTSEGTDPVTRRAGGFATVMSGPLSANARRHYNVSSQRRLAEGDHLTVELGVYVDGYWSDLTRVYAVGEPSIRLREIHALVERAQAAAIALMRPAVPAAEVDAAARRVIAEAGLADHFPHGLGHCLGLQWHEGPALVPASDRRLEAGEVYTVEPGVYIDGWGGVRIEDVVAVEPAGARVLAPYDHGTTPRGRGR